ncbi:NUDIX domain protein [[Clostridium] bifermentans ATCC 19299]|uniref:NUDIX domain-containing protein n=1 Tax=Paraclostridium bifermentans TaxID=1490 RepID=A0A5P3XJ45_PARBF|nr:NUDIX domain-containing protein [Paraclostridium bifermentans]MDM8127178.1 NUDIX domain-containing protein [Paraclostridium benzoelyticum]EQK39575.1 NUDIX domain protein [[Clostridium] bifermentans ATCC 19299] [Paraclostridium bifermentans ATCC 19299]MBN8049191.1 NUDIX domain-containing protein [Paraclostridium bifermentans]NME10779.1 NUDIX domain-containing protein [Paraclostridium bifermentans]QEZ70325.1 NUDIX domain-containing protein [Paraclostridium bifermentans]
MEIWDLYDKDRIKTGETMVRGSKFKENTYHLVVHVCIFNLEGKMLIQQRQPFKDGWPNMWDITVGGSAVSGDTSQLAAEREVYEEIGYKLSLDGIRPSLTINFDKGFDDIYLIQKDIDISKLKLQYEEVQSVKWASKEEILSMIDEEIFIPYHKSLIDLLFFMRTSKNSHTR